MRWLVLGWSCMLAGCTTYAARLIERPPHMGESSSRSLEPLLEEQGFQRQRELVAGGVHIAYWRAAPRAYHFTEQLRASPDGRQVSLHFSFDAPADRSLPSPRGSIVLLHPWGANGTMQFAWAVHFAAAGYTVILPDLRGHGDSDPAPLGYGPREADDVAALVTALRSRHELPEPLFLMGASYGGTVALFAATKLPEVRGVVALEPFANAADVIRRAPGSDLFGHRWLASWLDADRMDAALVRANRDLGVDLSQINASDAVDGTARCTLIMRGANDTLVTAEELQAVARHSPLASYVELSGESHISLPMRTDRLFDPLLAWMTQVQAGHCPAFMPLPAPSSTQPVVAQGITGGT